MKRPFHLLCVSILLVAGLISTSHSATWYITADGSGDAPTIQAAIDSAGMDDTLLVAPGTYSWSNQGTGNDYGMIHIMRGAPALTIVSEAGPEMTILDGEYRGRVFFYQGHYATEPGGLTIEGFTFTRGRPTQAGNLVGGGFTAHLSSPIIRDCVFRFCEAQQGGAYWYGGQGAPQLIDCYFEGNTAYYGAAVLFVNTSQTVMVSNCELRHNTSTQHGGAIFGYNAPLWIENSVIAFNSAVAQGGAIAFQKCYPSTVTQCTLYKNSAATGGGIAIVADTDLTVDHTIISNSLLGGSAAINGASSIAFSCSDLFGNVGGSWIAPFAGQNGIDGNFSVNALYCDTSPNTDLELEADSPCASGNHPDEADCGLIGARPVGCGGVPTEKRTWGAIKSLYSR